MLKTECTNCKCSVTSPLLAESKEMECPNCGAIFPVTDVFISAGPYSIYREVLLKNMHKYVRLLREAKIEVSDMEEKGKSSLPYRESAKTVDIFINRLKELLDGCRERFRVSGGQTSVEYSIEGGPCTGTLINISATGICLAMETNYDKVAPGKIIDLKVSDARLSEPLNLKGEVVWNTEKGLAGLRFIGLEEHIREPLCKFIAAKSSD